MCVTVRSVQCGAFTYSKHWVHKQFSCFSRPDSHAHCSVLSERKTKQKRRQQQLVTPAAYIMQRYRQLRKRKEETRVKSNVKLTALARSAESAEHNVSQNRLGAKVNSHTASGRVLTHAAMHTAGRVAERWASTSLWNENAHASSMLAIVEQLI